MVRINPKIETISAKINNGNLVSISSDLRPLGSKLIKSAMYVTPTDRDQPSSNIDF